MRINGDHYIYTSYDNILTKDNPTESEKTSTALQWNLYGGDPYAVKIRNGGNNRWIQYAATTSDVNALTFRADTLANCYFIAMRTTDHGYEMMAATGTDAATGNYYSIGHDAANTTVKLYRNDVYPHAANELQMILSTNELRAMYHIIDYDHKIVIEAEDENVELQVPLSIQSPFVAQYHFYHLNQFNVQGDTYELVNNPIPLSNITSASKDGDVYQIYVTYDKRSDVDLPSEENIKAGGNIKKYRLKYFGGEEFYQEDGGDKVMTTKTKAVYPYANGEANFYIYGEERLNIQMGAAATTRNRWPWYFESKNHDPYHVKVCSASTTYNLRATKWSATPTASDTLGSAREDGLRLYFRTYPVRYNGSTHIVTGAITKQSFVTSGAAGMSDASAVPTEYMVLGTSLSNCRLVTVGNVALDLRGRAASVAPSPPSSSTGRTTPPCWKFCTPPKA